MRETQTKIQWIPSHMNIDENDKADSLAKDACVNAESYKKERFIAKDVKTQIEEKVKEMWKSWYLNEIVSGKGLKSFKYFEEPVHKFWIDKFQHTFKGAEVKIMNRIVSGHDFSPACKKIMKIDESDQCEVCNKTSDATHLKFESKKYKKEISIQRKMLLLKYIVENELKI